MLLVNVSVSADPDSPTIGTFKPGSGSQMSLGLEVEKDNDNWYLVVNNPQDYEIPSQRYYSFSVLGDGALYDVVLNIENVDDESPYFLMPDSKSCEIKVSKALNKPHSLHIITD